MKYNNQARSVLEAKVRQFVYCGATFLRTGDDVKKCVSNKLMIYPSAMHSTEQKAPPPKYQTDQTARS